MKGKNLPRTLAIVLTLCLDLLAALLVSTSWGVSAYTTQQRLSDFSTIQPENAAFVDTPGNGVGHAPGIRSSGQEMGMLRRIAFGPYVGKLDPQYGPHPSPLPAIRGRT